MSLQGSIETFAIADVLRLLAATSKSGRLHVQGPSRAGTVWVDSAQILGAESPSTPHATGPVDILFQLLRFSRGSFRFELDKLPPEPGEPLDIEASLTEAEAMVVEWRELEQRIASADAWVQLAPALAGPSVTLEAADWTTLVAIAGGRTVAEIGDVLAVGELQTARALARLLDAGLVEISAKAPAGATRSVVSATPVRTTPIEDGASPADRNGAAAKPAEPKPAVEVTPTVVEAAPQPEVRVAEAPAPPAPPSTIEPPAAETGTASSGTVPASEQPKAERNGAAAPAAAPLAPPLPPAPPVAPVWTSSEPGTPGWTSPDFPSLTPPPEPAPPAPALSDAPRAEAGLLNPKPAPEADFRTPPETGLDGNAADPFSYVPGSERSDIYTYPPLADAPPVWEPSTESTGSGANGVSDNGYPPLPPPLPPVYGTTSAVPTLPPQQPSWTAEPAAEQASAPAADVAPPLPPKADTWLGPLSDAIAKADAPSGGDPAAPRPEAVAPVPPAPPAPLAPIADLTVPPPPPAPPAPVGAWSSPASLFDAGLPERLAPPPPPPPPPVASALQSLADPSVAVSPTLLNGAVTLTDQPAADLTEDADDIERQLFNLSPRAREAVKQSSGLYDGRGRR